MAEFSKQYLEKGGFDFEADFDIIEIANDLDNGYYTSIICEGFGFTAIGKDDDGNIIVAMPVGDYTSEGVEVEWKKLDDLLKS